MSRTITNSIIAHIAENDYYSPCNCPWHFNRSCLLILNNFDKRRFHCLYASHSIQWKSYNVSGSCDIPEFFYDLILLNRQLGSEYVLPFVTHYRERSGYTIGFYEMKAGLYNARIVKAEYLAEAFYTMTVFFCAICKRLGGHAPIVKNLSFVYTERHPVIVDLCASNVEKRERIGNHEFLNEKKWNRFMKNRTTREIVRYLKIIQPEFFKKKCRANNNCILSDEIQFNDETHQLICKSKCFNLVKVLTEFEYLISNLKVRQVIQGWLNDLKDTTVI